MIKEKKKSKLHMSAKTFIFIVSIFLIVLCIGIYSVCMFYAYKTKLNKNIVDNLKIQEEMISNQLNLVDYKFTGEGNTLDSDINQIADILNGRIIVINREYEIVKDTYIFMQGKYMINDNVMDIMTGKKPETIIIQSDYVEMLSPVKNDENEIVGVIISTASLKESAEMIQYLHNKSVILIAVTVFIGAIIAFWLARISILEVDRINKSMSKMYDGNIESNMPAKGFKETRILAENYNSILSKLDSMDSTRQEFVSNVSHELKTPITSMKVLAESVLQNTEATADVYKEFMDDIVDEIDRETKIINDLLILVKTDKQSAVINIAEVDINELIEVILKRVTPIADRRGIELIYESYREVKAEVDEIKLSLAFSNLIENAVKYNVDNGTVKVSLNADHKYFYIKVADTGVGIPDDCKDKVFERFYRVDKARSRDTGGTGLGLAIARNAILLHEGTIKLYSESGKGTTFTVKIPLKHMENK